VSLSAFFFLDFDSLIWRFELGLRLGRRIGSGSSVVAGCEAGEADGIEGMDGLDEANEFVEDEEAGMDGTPEMDPPSLTPPLPPKKTPLHHNQLQRPPSDDGDRPAWFASQLECAICLSQFEVGDRVRLLPCGHIFHLQEVDEWLIRQRKVVCVTVFSEVMHCQPATAQCPVCKMDVTMPQVHSPSPTSRVLSFALPPMNWRTVLSRQLDELREWVGRSPAQRRTEVGA